MNRGLISQAPNAQSLILIREATPSDHDQLKAVSHDAHATLRKVYRPCPSAKAIGTENPYIRIVAIKDGLIVGMATYEVDGDSFYFGSLGVLDHYRKQGVARALVRHIEGIALKDGFKKLTCATVEETGNAPIFEKLGFKIISRSIAEKFESLIEKPIHEVTMEKTLPENGYFIGEIILESLVDPSVLESFKTFLVSTRKANVENFTPSHWNIHRYRMPNHEVLRLLPLIENNLDKNQWYIHFYSEDENRMYVTLSEKTFLLPKFRDPSWNEMILYGEKVGVGRRWTENIPVDFHQESPR